MECVEKFTKPWRRTADDGRVSLLDVLTYAERFCVENDLTWSHKLKLQLTEGYYQLYQKWSESISKEEACALEAAALDWTQDSSAPVAEGNRKSSPLAAVLLPGISGVSVRLK